MNLAATQAIDLQFETTTRSSQNVIDWVQRYQDLSRVSGRSWRKNRRRAVRGLHVAREGAYRIVKRTLDIIAAAIKLTDGGPVLYWQKRVGMWGELFDFPKFRSMILDADKIIDKLAAANDHGKSITFKMKHDPRVTPVGRFIRRFSLDEFPQLICVLRGQMSLVGPRPALPREVKNYSQVHRRRLDVRPGLTCIWQVSGRGNVPFERQVEMDVEYVESHNLWLDLRLVAYTVPAVITGRGAY